MNTNNRIYLDQKGYDRVVQEIEELRKKLNKLRLDKSYAYENSGDGFHDNFAFEEAERNERILMYEITSRLEMLNNAIIVQNQKQDNIVDVNDVVSLTIDFGEKETNLYRLVGSSNFLSNDGITNISLNSPLGQAIYLKSVGSSVTYSVNGEFFPVFINSKVDNKILDNDESEKKFK